MFCLSAARSNGSPATTTTSARLPGVSEPVWAARPSSSAAELVVATSTSDGVMPPAAIRESSSRLLPCGPTPLSVPIATCTPAATAGRLLADRGVVVQAGEVGGGPAGGPALRVCDPYGTAAAQGVAEHLVHRVVDCPLPRGEERQQRGP